MDRNKGEKKGKVKKQNNVKKKETGIPIIL
jgi:hypothetical protein